MGKEQRFGKSRVLAPEHDEAFIGICHIRIAVLRFCSEKEALTAAFREEIVEAVVITDIKVMPIVKTGAFQVLVRGLEAHWLDNVQPGTRYGAGSGYISGVLGDSRLRQNDIEFRF